MRSPPSFPELFPFRASGGTLPPAPFSFATLSEPFCGSLPPAGEAHCLSLAPKAVPPTAPAASPPFRHGLQLSFKHTSHPDTLPHLGSPPPSGLASPVPTSDENPQRCHPGCEQRFRDGDKSLLGSEVARSGCAWDGLWDRTCWPATCLCPSCVRFLVNKVDPTFLVEIAGPFFYQRGDSSDCVLPS